MKKGVRIETTIASYRDPIVEEVRRAREANAARFGYDIRKIVEDALKRQATSGHRVVDLSQEPTPQGRKLRKAGEKGIRRKGLASSR